MTPAPATSRRTKGASGRCGRDAKANALGLAMSARLTELVASRAMLRVQAVPSTDTGPTP